MSSYQQLASYEMLFSTAWKVGICLYHIRTNHECEGEIEKIVPRLTDWQHDDIR